MNLPVILSLGLCNGIAAVLRNSNGGLPGLCSSSANSRVSCRDLLEILKIATINISSVG